MPHSDLDKRRAYYREWKRTPGKKWADKCYTAARHANQRAARYGVAGRITTADVRAVLGDAPGVRCTYCGSTHFVGIDHRAPLHSGGANDRQNLVPCCQSCNSSKFRQDRPRRWAREWDRCRDCGTTARPHRCHGRCTRCYERSRVPEASSRSR